MSSQCQPPSPRLIAYTTEIPHRGRLWPRGLPTRTGMGLLAMLLVLGIVAANPGLNLLLLLLGLGLGAVLFNALLARWQVNLAQVRRILPDVAAVGRPTTIRYQVRNRSRWMALHGLWLVDGYTRCPAGLPLLVAWIPHVPPGASAGAEARVVPARRGLCRIDSLRLASKFPFGLFKRLRGVPLADQVLVWPALWKPRVQWLGRTARSLQPRSLRNSHVQRGSEEFFGIHEYRPGDNVRWIHWRRSAALDRVLVREMVDADPGRITLALETAGPAGPVDPRTLDGLVSAAASLACDALERGWHVGVVLNGQTTVALPPAGGHATRSRLLYELAVLAPSPNRRLLDVLRAWPAGAAWTGRAVLIHPGGAPDDPAVEAAAAQLAAAVGPVLPLSSEVLPDWFDMGPHPAARPADDPPRDRPAVPATAAPPAVSASTEDRP